MASADAAPESRAAMFKAVMTAAQRDEDAIAFLHAACMAPGAAHQKVALENARICLERPVGLDPQCLTSLMNDKARVGNGG